MVLYLSAQFDLLLSQSRQYIFILFVRNSNISLFMFVQSDTLPVYRINDMAFGNLFSFDNWLQNWSPKITASMTTGKCPGNTHVSLRRMVFIERGNHSCWAFWESVCQCLSPFIYLIYRSS